MGVAPPCGSPREIFWLTVSNPWGLWLTQTSLDMTLPRTNFHLDRSQKVMKIHENSWKFTDINGSNNYAGRSLSWLLLVSIRLIYVTCSFNCIHCHHAPTYVAWYAIVVQGQIFSQTGHKHFWEFMKFYGCLHDKPGTDVDPPKDVSVLSYGMSQCCSKPPQTQKKTHCSYM